MQEVVRSVVAKKFANLKSLEDFMSRNNIKVDRERESNYPNCKKACGVFVCVSYLSRAHVKNAKFFQRVLQAQWPASLPLHYATLVLQASYDLWVTLLSICHIRPHLS
jgi:hypothetical protein